MRFEVQQLSLPPDADILFRLQTTFFLKKQDDADLHATWEEVPKSWTSHGTCTCDVSDARICKPNVFVSK